MLQKFWQALCQFYKGCYTCLSSMLAQTYCGTYCRCIQVCPCIKLRCKLGPPVVQDRMARRTWILRRFPAARGMALHALTRRTTSANAASLRPSTSFRKSLWVSGAGIEKGKPFKSSCADPSITPTPNLQHARLGVKSAARHACLGY